MSYADKVFIEMCRDCLLYTSCRQSLRMFLIANQLGICYDNLIEFLCQMEEYHEEKTSFKGTYNQR